MPRTSRAELIVLALDLRLSVHFGYLSGMNTRVHAATSTSSGTSMANDVETLFIGNVSNRKGT